jgi:acetyl/propionyl-CoA carboxylase alpha subunit
LSCPISLISFTTSLGNYEKNEKLCRYIAQNLGLAEVPNYFDDDQAIQEAEALIEARGLTPLYIKMLNAIAVLGGGGGRGVEALKNNSSFNKAHAMAAMFRNIRGETLQSLRSRPSS